KEGINTAWRRKFESPMFGRSRRNPATRGSSYVTTLAGSTRRSARRSRGRRSPAKAAGLGSPSRLSQRLPRLGRAARVRAFGWRGDGRRGRVEDGGGRGSMARGQRATEERRATGGVFDKLK